MDDPHQAAIDKFPEAYARTQRFAAGAPRNLSVLGDAKKVSNNTDAETQTETSSGDTNRGDVNPGNGRVLFLRAASSTDPTLCLWTLEVDSGSETLLFDPRNLEQAALTEAEKARRERTREAGTGIVSYHLDRDRTKACFTVSGSLVVVDLETGAAETPPVGGTVFDPRLSPDGNFVAYVDGDCLRLLELGNPGSDRVLISDSIQGISYGRADFVAAEEMGRRRGFWWGPSSTDLIVTKVDERPVNKWWTGDPAHPGQKPATIRYPQAGTRNAHTALLNIVAETGESREIHWDADDHYEYLANVIWQATSPDPDDPEANTNPIIVRQTRDQREVSIAELDLETYSLRTLDTLLDDVWVELIPTCPTRSKFGLLTIEDLWEESPAA